jgi:hypothetical protein
MQLYHHQNYHINNEHRLISLFHYYIKTDDNNVSNNQSLFISIHQNSFFFVAHRNISMDKLWAQYISSQI